MADSSREFQVKLIRQMAERLRDRVRQMIDSETLKRSLDIRIIDQEGEQVGAVLFLPQYWAVYYHDGRGPVRPKNGRFIVYFQNIEDDPRVNGGADYPIRQSQIRRLRLDPAEFRRLVESGKLIVRDSVAPARPHPFFERLGGKAPKLVGSLALREFRKHLKSELDDVLRLKETVRFRL